MSIQEAVRPRLERGYAPDAGCPVDEFGPRDEPNLSGRQLRIGRLLETGAKDAAIARQLGLSVRTVQSDVSGLVAALGASSRFQAGCLLVRYFG